MGLLLRSDEFNYIAVRVFYKGKVGVAAEFVGCFDWFYACCCGLGEGGVGVGHQQGQVAVAEG